MEEKVFSMNKKEYYRFIAIQLIITFLLVGLAFTPNKIYNVNVTIGGNVSEKSGCVLDKKIPFELPINFEMAIPTGGCGKVNSKKATLNLKGMAEVYVNIETKESYLRFPELKYDLVVSSDGEVNLKSK